MVALGMLACGSHSSQDPVAAAAGRSLMGALMAENLLGSD